MFNISSLIRLKKGNMFLIELKGSEISVEGKNNKYADYILGDNSTLTRIEDQYGKYYALKFCVKVSKIRFTLSNYKIKKVFNESGYYNLNINMPNWPPNSINFTFNVLPSKKYF